VELAGARHSQIFVACELITNPSWPAWTDRSITWPSSTAGQDEVCCRFV